MIIDKSESIQRVNQLAQKGTPFLLISDFKGEQNHVIPIDEVDKEKVLFELNSIKNTEDSPTTLQSIDLKKCPIELAHYQKAYEKVQDEIKKGNTYLLNLTFPTPIETNYSLKEIYHHASARYKLYFDDEFVVFTPETFIQIKDREISSFPMKGTINADIPNAENIILSDEKEMAEHALIVDLIRNDMSHFASHVNVDRFRYIEKINTNDRNLLQVSSKITGRLSDNYLRRLGDIIYALLPAGSVTGAPKAKTLEIIDAVENYKRGYYTGIFGYFDGQKFDSAVMIRYIEKNGEQLTYKSGGGIHFLSDMKSEYQELINKIYVPVH